MRWLLADPTDRRIVVDWPSRENVLLFDGSSGHGRDPGFQPMADETVTVVVVEPMAGRLRKARRTWPVKWYYLAEHETHRVGGIGDEITIGRRRCSRLPIGIRVDEIRPDVGLQQLVELYGDEGLGARGSKEPALVTQRFSVLPEAQNARSLCADRRFGL